VPDIPLNATPFEQAPLNKQRADKFLLIITPPAIFRNYDLDRIYPEAIQYSVYGTVIPAVTVPSVTVGYANQTLKVSSYSRTPYEDISVNFTVDNRFKNYYFIYKWLDILNDDVGGLFAKTDERTIDTFVTPVRSLYKGKQSEEALYMSDFIVYSLDEYNNKVAQFTYTKAFPITLGSLTANYRDSSLYDTTFTFSFSQLYMKLLI